LSLSVLLIVTTTVFTHVFIEQINDDDDDDDNPLPKNPTPLGHLGLGLRLCGPRASALRALLPGMEKWKVGNASDDCLEYEGKLSVLLLCAVLYMIVVHSHTHMSSS